MKRRNLIADFVSVTFSVPDELKKNVGGIKEGLSSYRSISAKYVHNFIPQYFSTWIFDVNYSNLKFSFKLSFNPINKNTRFFRLEFNPNKAGIRGIRKIKEILNRVLEIDDVELYIRMSRITRIDISVDRFNLKCFYYALFDRSCYSEVVTVDDNTTLARDTQVIGNGKRRLIIYDKGYELGDRKLNCMRYEMRLRNIDFSLLNIENLENPFVVLRLFDSRIFSDDFFSDEFLVNVTKYGIPYALHGLDDYQERRKYISELAKYERNILGINSLWSSWPRVAQKLKCLYMDI